MQQYGQADNAFTPIQLVRYIAMIADGGKDPGVTIVKSVADTQGNEVNMSDVQNYVDRELGVTSAKLPDVNMDANNLKAILQGMKDVTTDEQGTAYSVFKNFNISVGGKTGSAETGLKDVNKKDIVNAWFAGFAPYDNPEIAIVVNVENGKHGVYTSEVARDIWKAYFGMNGDVTENRAAKPISGTQN